MYDDAFSRTYHPRRLDDERAELVSEGVEEPEDDAVAGLAVPVQLGGDDAGVQGVRGDAAALQARAKLAREVDVGHLALSVRLHRAELQNIA